MAIFPHQWFAPCQRTALLAGLWCLPLFSQLVPPERSVLDDERGQYYGYSATLDSLGAAVFNPHNLAFTSMQPDAIKGVHGHFHHVAPADPSDDFPYDELKAFEASEIAAGRPPIFATATYAGKKRPVYFEWHLALDSSFRPTAPSPQWSQAVNLRDDRFINFYVHVYLRKRLWTPYLKTLWHAVDNCSFRYNNYGVLDDAGVYHYGLTWDFPFAQNDADFLDSIKYFFARLQQVAPDVKVMGNEGSMNDESRFADVWSGFAGTIREDITLSSAGDSYSRNEVYKFYNRYKWEGLAGKASILRALLPAEADPAFASLMRTTFAAYLVFRGPSFFFGPRYDDATVMEVPLSRYARMRDDLGAPNGDAMDSQAINQADSGYRLYWRQYEGGIVYWNSTGAAQTITLPTTQSYYNSAGLRITSLTIPDLRGDYVLLSPNPRAAKPTINPRSAVAFTGPLAVKIASDTPGATIRYTLDGTTPSSSSPVYSGNLALTSSATVKARAFAPGYDSSFAASATYNLLSAPPTVGFYLPEDSGTAYFSAYYPMVALSNASAQTVTVSYAAIGGTAIAGTDYVFAPGTLALNPGEIYGRFPITILNSGSEGAGKTIVVGLSAPVNAVLSAQTTFAYTIGSASAPPAPPTPPMPSNGSPSGTLAAGTTSVQLSLTTDKPATCRYSTTPGTSYDAMTQTFAATGGTFHATGLSGLTAGSSYAYYVRCRDSGGNTNTDDYAIAFAIAAAQSISISVAPASVQLTASQRQQFTATVSGITNQNVTWTLSPATGVISSAGLYTAPASISSTQSVSVIAVSHADPTKMATATVTLVPPVSSPGVLTLPIRVNAGGGAYVDPLGQLWNQDTGYQGGVAFSTTHTIAGTTTPQLYQTGRSGSLTYRFAIPNGTYTVNVKFAETVYSKEGQRVFTVLVNNEIVDSNLDVLGTAGGAFIALDRQYLALVTNGQLTIQLVPVIGAPEVNGIEVY